MKVFFAVWIVICSLFLLQCKKTNISAEVTEEIRDSTNVPSGSGHEPELTVRVDRGFEKELIRQGIDKLGVEDGKIRYSDIKDIETLTIRPQIKEDIQGLKGIEHFISLKSFTTLYTKPDSLDFSKNTKLEYLHIETGYEVAGERKTLKYVNVRNCKELRYLNVRSNMITALDVSENKLLKELRCDDNYTLKSIDLSANPDLEVLVAPSSEDFKLLELRGNKNLRKLVCYARGVERLDLSMLPKLTFLALGIGQAKLDLGDKPVLDTLNLMYTTVENPDLSKATNLLSLDMGDGLESIDLKQLKELRHLSYRGNNLSLLDLTENKNLEKLVIGQSNLTAINLSANSKIQEIYGMGWQKLTNLDLKAQVNLKKFIVLDSPKLSTICVKQIPAMSDVNWQIPQTARYSLCE